MIRGLLRKFHYFATLTLLLGLIPAFHLVHLPLRFGWKSYFLTYWWSLAFQSAVACVVLYAIGFPSELWSKLTSRTTATENPRQALLALLVPAAYFFLMFFLVFSYNDVIAMLRFNGLADVALNRADAWIMGGLTVSSLAHGLPLRASGILEGIYFLMFSQVGACLILLALRCGRDTAMRYIATITTAYYLGLICFYFVPATGPYYLSLLARDGNYIGVGQRTFAQMLNSMKDHDPLQIIGTDYSIALPCLHVTQPLIALWFVRKWRRVAWVLAVYLLALIPAILLLEQHYVVDLIGGVVVAAIAIGMLSPVRSQHPRINSLS